MRAMVKSYPCLGELNTHTHTYGNLFCIRFTCYVSFYCLYCLLPYQHSVTAISAFAAIYYVFKLM